MGGTSYDSEMPTNIPDGFVIVRDHTHPGGFKAIDPTTLPGGGGGGGSGAGLRVVDFPFDFSLAAGPHDVFLLADGESVLFAALYTAVTFNGTGPSFGWG